METMILHGSLRPTSQLGVRSTHADRRAGMVKVPP